MFRLIKVKSSVKQAVAARESSNAVKDRLLNGLLLFWRLLLIVLTVAAISQSIAAQETNQQEKIFVRTITDFDAKVSADLPVTYLELIRKVFPARRSLAKELDIGGVYDVEDFRLRAARGTIPLRPLTAKPARTERHDSPVSIDSVRALVLGENRRHIALVIGVRPGVMGEEGYYALAVFSLSAKPRLVAAFDPGWGQNLNFDDEFFYEEESENGALFWVMREQEKGSAISEKEYIMLELKDETVRVIVEDLPFKRTSTLDGFNQTSDYRFFSVLRCGQEYFSAGRKVYRLWLNEEWKAIEGTQARAEGNRKREREYLFYWNKRLGRYEKRFEHDDFNIVDVSEKSVVVEKNFKGFEKPKALAGKAVLLDKVYELTLYGGGDFWDWEGEFAEPPRTEQEFYFNFYFAEDFPVKKYGDKRYRLDVKFVITGIRRERNEDGSWRNVYNCYITAAKER